MDSKALPILTGHGLETSATSGGSFANSTNHVAAIGLLRWVSAIRPLIWILLRLRSQWGEKKKAGSMLLIMMMDEGGDDHDEYPDDGIWNLLPFLYHPYTTRVTTRLLMFQLEVIIYPHTLLGICLWNVCWSAQWFLVLVCIERKYPLAMHGAHLRSSHLQPVHCQAHLNDGNGSKLLEARWPMNCFGMCPVEKPGYRVIGPPDYSCGHGRMIRQNLHKTFGPSNLYHFP